MSGVVSRASPARRAAFRILEGVERRSGEPATLLNAPEVDELIPSDRGLATELVYGVLRRRASLDFVLEHHSNRPLAKVDSRILRALRMGLYQLLHSSRIPARAAIDETVRLVHGSGASWGAGFANAVLRNVARHPNEPLLPTKESDPVAYLVTALSHPEWLVRRYIERLGFERAEERCLIQNEVPPVDLRIAANQDPEHIRSRLLEQGVVTEPIPLSPRGLRVLSGSIQSTKSYADGTILIQDGGAQVIPELLAVDSSSRVLDACAAPGGKTTSLAEAARDGFVLAVDRRLRRSKIVRALSRRLNLEGRVRVVTADATQLPIEQTFDRILVDAPCTSLGTLRRNPDIKWRVEEDDLAPQAREQLAILNEAATRLEPGGRLVYATCSTEPEENSAVVESFLSAHPGFRRSDLPLRLSHMATPAGDFETRPERDGVDGYFAAILTRD